MRFLQNARPNIYPPPDTTKQVYGHWDFSDPNCHFPDRQIVRLGNDACHKLNFEADATLIKLSHLRGTLEEDLFRRMYWLRSFHVDVDHSPSFQKVIDLPARTVTYKEPEKSPKSTWEEMVGKTSLMFAKIDHLYQALSKEEFETSEEVRILLDQLEAATTNIQGTLSCKELSPGSIARQRRKGTCGEIKTTTAWGQRQQEKIHLPDICPQDVLDESPSVPMASVPLTLVAEKWDVPSCQVPGDGWGFSDLSVNELPQWKYCLYGRMGSGGDSSRRI